MLTIVAKDWLQKQPQNYLLDIITKKVRGINEPGHPLKRSPKNKEVSERKAEVLFIFKATFGSLSI